MKRNNYLIGLIVLIISAFFLGLSVNCYIKAGIGSDSITVFEEGLSTTLNISLGNASYLYCILTLGLAMLFGRKYIGWTSIAFSLLSGIFIDLTSIAFIGIENINITIKIILLGLAIFFCGISCALLILFQKGMNTLDALATGLSDKLRVDYKIIRTILDILLMMIGYLMGGTIGLGTIPAVLLTGTCIDFIVEFIKTNVNKRYDFINIDKKSQ